MHGTGMGLLKRLQRTSFLREKWYIRSLGWCLVNNNNNNKKKKKRNKGKGTAPPHDIRLVFAARRDSLSQFATDRSTTAEKKTVQFDKDTQMTLLIIKICSKIIFFTLFTYVT